MVYFTPSTSLAAWKVKQTMEKKKKILKLCSQALEGKAAAQHLEQRLLERFLDGGKKKTNLTASRKRIPSSLYSIQLLWLSMSAQEHKCLLSSFFHIWKIYRDCKYLEVLWQWMLPFLITQCSLINILILYLHPRVSSLSTLCLLKTCLQNLYGILLKT